MFAFSPDKSLVPVFRLASESEKVDGSIHDTVLAKPTEVPYACGHLQPLRNINPSYDCHVSGVDSTRHVARVSDVQSADSYSTFLRIMAIRQLVTVRRSIYIDYRVHAPYCIWYWYPGTQHLCDYR